MFLHNFCKMLYLQIVNTQLHNLISYVLSWYDLSVLYDVLVPFKVTGLSVSTSNQPYRLYILALSSESKSATFYYLLSVPSKVTGVTASPMLTSRPSLNLTWSAPSSNRPIQHYQVDYRVSTSGNWSTWSPNPTSTSVTLTSLQSGTTYQVRVRPVSDVGNGEWSEVIGITTYSGEFYFTL